LKKKKQQELEETIKLEEQFNFMNKFNQDVRERNKMRLLKVHRTRTRVRKHRKNKLSAIYYSFY